MSPLNLDTFIVSGPDPETNHYRVLQGLKAYRDEFIHNRLFPALAELIDLLTTLRALVDESSALKRRIPQQLKDIDLQERKLLFEPLDLNNADLARVLELMRWAIPHIEETLEEGTRIYDFVEENIAVEEVGIMPVYREEGYYFVPEHAASLLHLLRYEASLFTSGNERFRTLKTNIIESIRQSRVHASPEVLKMRLIREYHDLPNPATFLCETELEFPFAETILPVAKRKLMARVFS